ncbi:MAG: hypothetical protein ABFR05_06295 [Bacteroidota bacterium]
MNSKVKHLQSNEQNSFDEQLNELHSEDLGIGIPKDYFAKSKEDILAKVSGQKKETKVLSFYRKRVVWFAAAGIALLLTFNLFNRKESPNFDNFPAIVSDTLDQIKVLDLANGDFLSDEDDIMVASLFVDDAEIDEYLDKYVLEDMMGD